MKTASCTLLLLLLVSITACKKDQDPAVLPTEMPKRLMLSKMVHKVINISSPGRMANDTLYFTYDDNGRVTNVKVTSPDMLMIIPGYSFSYMGDKLTGINVLNQAGEVYMTYNDPLNILNADSSLIQVSLITSRNDGSDSVINTYRFEDSLLSSILRYYRPANEPSRTGQFSYDYNTDGNVVRYFENEQLVWMATEWDNKKNMFRDLDRTQFLLFHAGNFAPDGSIVAHYGKNNPTKIQFANGNVVQLGYEYNEEEYPIKMTFKGHPQVEFEKYYFYE